MLVHHRVTPSIKFASTHLNTWVERGTARVKCLSQEHNAMTPARPRTRAARPGDEHTNHDATAAPSNKAISKNIYKEVRSKVKIIPTAQLKYSEKYNYQLDWKEIYRIPFRVSVDSRSREFQFKVLHRYLATNKFLHKIGLVPSSLCTFCEREGESTEHLLIECDYSNKFWQDLINWFNMIDIKVKALSESDKIFGLWKREVDFHLLNHFLILTKQHIYSCHKKGYLLSLKAHLTIVASIYQIETTIAESNGKQTFHDAKWKKFLAQWYFIW